VETTTWIWISGALSALLSGLGKTGIPGVGILPIALFALLFPARASVGIMLPLLICGDIVGVSIYRRKAHGRQLLRLFPWTAAGVIPGWLLMKRIDDNAVGWLIGSILLFLIGIHLLRRLRARKASDGTQDETGTTHGSLYTAITGALAGFTSMVSNGAGPIMVLYLLAMRLPKIEFVGTQAWFFFALNLFKVPFGVEAGLITGDSLVVSAQLAPAMVLGAIAGPWVLRRINQKVFEVTALVLTVVAAAWLIAKPWIVPTSSGPTDVRTPPPAPAGP
jgi:uncharacterized membrane protein YfcA